MLTFFGTSDATPVATILPYEWPTRIKLSNSLHCMTFKMSQT